MANQLELFPTFSQSNCQKDGVDAQYLCITSVAIVSLMAIIWWETLVYVYNMKAGMAAENRELRRMLGELSNKLNNLPKPPNNNAPSTEDVRCVLESFKEKMEVSNKTFQIQLQKVIQENAKMTQHISVLSDMSKTIQQCLGGYVCVGVWQNHQPYFVKRDKTDMMLGENGGLHGHVNYLVLSQLTKTQVKKFDVHILLNVPVKIHNEETHIHINDLNVQHNQTALRHAYKYLGKIGVEVIMTPDKNTNDLIMRIVNQQ